MSQLTASFLTDRDAHCPSTNPTSCKQARAYFAEFEVSPASEWCLMCAHPQKLKSLKNYCLELDWYKPSEDQMARRSAASLVQPWEAEGKAHMHAFMHTSSSGGCMGTYCFKTLHPLSLASWLVEGVQVRVYAVALAHFDCTCNSLQLLATGLGLYMYPRKLKRVPCAWCTHKLTRVSCACVQTSSHECHVHGAHKSSHKCERNATPFQEGLSVNEATLKELCRTCNGDVRLVLGQLQMLRLKARSLTYDQVKVRCVCRQASVPCGVVCGCKEAANHFVQCCSSKPIELLDLSSYGMGIHLNCRMVFEWSGGGINVTCPQLRHGPLVDAHYK
eukprot:scaffold50382_cov22-Tisochrysis_lutea.AAC.1